MVQNKGLIFREVPTSWPEVGKHIKIEDRDFDLDQAPPSGGATAKVNYSSFDPYMRGRMRKPEAKSYSPPSELGKPIEALSIVTIIKSDHDKFKAGDVVRVPRTGIEEYSVLPKGLLDASRLLENPYNLDTKLFLGALGMPGLTAYASFYGIGEPKKGETIFVSAASGAVGQIVGQLAKHEGLTVIGSVGDDKKLEFIEKELNFDGGFNYKKEKPLEALQRLAPQGIDIYYDNVGGEQLEAAITHINDFGRIVACGMISQYNLPPDQLYGIKNLTSVVRKRLRFQGFIVTDPNMAKYSEEHSKNVGKWIHDGTFKALEDVTYGIDNAGEGFVGMLAGKNFGKAVLEVSKI